MTRRQLSREMEPGGTGPLRTLRWTISILGTLLLGWTATLPLPWRGQFLLALLTLLAAGALHRRSSSRLVTLTLVLLSTYSTLRYGFWRYSSTILYLRDPGNHWTGLDACLLWMLLLAESYAFVALLLGYFQTLWPLRRPPVPLSAEPEDWPAVDVLIPTCDEPLSVARFTALAAMNIDWPAEKLHVYLLDDGRREEFRAFAEQAGIGYMAREDNRHAKAGNLNFALARVRSPFVAVFDCDHVPTRSFLQLTLGWFQRDPGLAMLQTPQHSYSPGPFERNLDQFHTTPGEDELFYGVVQDGNDLWNATAFCGSCAVLRRAALDEAGGFAVETLTEDVHTSLRMQRRGWNTAYINIPQAAGLASERLSSHIRQRVRWARGMVQILRLENPLFARGLKLPQRLCYFNAMAHFLYALPRLIFLIAPTLYLVFGIRILPGLWLAIVAYALPHLGVAAIASSRIDGRYRHSFWNSIYETVLAPYLLLPTVGALLQGKPGRFNVTAKGGTVPEAYFDARIARPFVWLAAFNFLALLCAAGRSIQLPRLTVEGWLRFVNWPAKLYDAGHRGTILVNAVWALFNLTILGVAIAVAREAQQRRRAVRVAVAVPSDLVLADGSMIQGMTCDLSSGGVRTILDRAAQVKVGEPIQFVFPVLDGSATLPATIVSIDGTELRAEFPRLSLEEDEALAMILYSRANAWIDPRSKPDSNSDTAADHPVRSLARILRLAGRGLLQAVTAGRTESRGRLVTSVVPLVLVALALAGPLCAAQPAGQAPNATAAKIAAVPGVFTTSFALHDLAAAVSVGSMGSMGSVGSIELHGTDDSASVSFATAGNRLLKTASLKLHYRFSPGLLPGIGYLNVRLNGVPISTLTASAAQGTGGGAGPLDAMVQLPVELMTQENRLTFQLIGHSNARCEDPANSTLWVRIDGTSTIELAGSLLPPTNDLSALPRPFYVPGVNEPGVGLHPAVPIVFLAPPSPKQLQAAGVVASWLGTLYGLRTVEFPVSIGTLPTGNVIEFAAAPDASIAMVTNPADPYGSLLVVSGNNDDELLMAASALVLHNGLWQGQQVAVHDLALPAPRQPDDAPAWLSTEGKPAAIGADVQSDGSRPQSISLRLPPDLAFGDRQNLAFHLSYRYNGVALASGSTLQIFLNGTFISATPMPHSDKASTVLETVVPIPVADLRPFSNTLTFRFNFQPAARACPATAQDQFQSAILKDSYLDISGIPHATELPNLELFAHAGYPFTRLADLSETAVVVPASPTPGEIGLFLGLMGQFGAETGYPALRVAVTHADGMSTEAAKDFLVIGTPEDQAAWRLLGGTLPLRYADGALMLDDPEGPFPRWVSWHSVGSDQGQLGRLLATAAMPDAWIESVEWPARSNRSAVAIVVRDDAALPSLVSAFLGASQASESSQIAQSVSVLRGGRFSSFRTGQASYQVGRISVLDRLAYGFEAAPWLIALVAIFFCWIMAAVIEALLRRRARLRLGAEAD